MSGILADVRKELRRNARADIRDSAKRFFKENVKVYGIKTATVQLISKKHFSRIRHLQKDEIYELCEGLFRSGFMEESFIACNWSYSVRKKFEERDLLIFERWLSLYISNWASCDTLCNHTVGSFIEMFPARISALKKWAKSKNMWMRRAAAVSLIVPAKKGEFLKEAFGISDILLHDSEDLVQKGYGWLLKEESRVRQKEVFNYVMRNKKTMPRTALRYAIEKMPPALRATAMGR